MNELYGRLVRSSNLSKPLGGTCDQFDGIHVCVIWQFGIDQTLLRQACPQRVAELCWAQRPLCKENPENAEPQGFSSVLIAFQHTPEELAHFGRDFRKLLPESEGAVATLIV